MSAQQAERLALTPLQKAAYAVKEMRARLDQVERGKQEPIAIIGMACRFPSADGLEEYWQLLSQGIDGIGEVPKARWDLEKYFDENPGAPGKINTRYGGFIDNIDQFDASFFGISPMEAERLDPQHRLLLEMTWHALEDAGQAPSELRGTSCGVFVGISQNDYGVSQLAGPVEGIQAYTGTGNGFCFAAGRLAYTFGLNGPTFSVDTACSSSLVALHQATQAIRNGECDTAIVAGVQLNITPPMQVFLSKTQSFSPQGRCRTFDEAANGFVLGEGAGVLVLRKQSLALQRTDPIHALLRGTGINHDGASSGLTVPNERAQESLVRAVIERCKLTPDSIDYIETHGTATELGDPIELGALRAVFGVREDTEPLYVGSVKTNIGHLGAAAGIAGLIKTVLMLGHETVAPNLHYRQPSSRIAWENFSVQVPSTPQPWPRQRRVRRAGISSFGLSGTNAHIIVEESPARAAEVPPKGDRHRHLVTLSAHDENALLALAQAYGDIEPGVCFANIAYSANTGRSHLAQRLIVNAASRDEFDAALESFIDRKANPKLFSGRVGKGGAGRLAFIFGDHFPLEALKPWALLEPRIASSIASCERIYNALELNSRQRQDAAVFSAQWALVQWLDDCGIAPQAVTGQGMGLLIAQCVAGMFDLKDAFLLLAGGEVDALSPQVSVYQYDDNNALQPMPFQGVAGHCFSSQINDTLVNRPLESALRDSGYGTSVLLGFEPGIGCVINGSITHSAKDLGSAVLNSIAALYVQGFDVNWLGFDAPYARHRVALPKYIFQRKRHWLEGMGREPGELNADAVHGNPLEDQQFTPKETSLKETNIEARHSENSASLAESDVSIDVKPRIQQTRIQQARVTSTENNPLAAVLRKQLQSASSAINDVVAQQLAFLKSPAQMGYPEPGEALPAAANQDSLIADKTTALANRPSLPPYKTQISTAALGDWNLLKINADNQHDALALIKHWHHEATQNNTSLNSLAIEGAEIESTEIKSTEIYAKKNATLARGGGKTMLLYQHLDDAAVTCGLCSKDEKPAAINSKRLISNFTPMPRSMVFMFPGVGDHYLNMAQGLYRHEAVFRKEIDHCCDLVKSNTSVDLRKVLYPPGSVLTQPTHAEKKTAKPGFDLRAMLGRGAASSDPNEALLNTSTHSQPLVFMIEYALAKTWQSKGIQADAMIGYSIGEYTAACLAGVIRLEDVLQLISERAALIETMPSGILLAVPLTETDLKPLLDDTLSIAIISTVNQCVVGGSAQSIADLEKRLASVEVVSRRLPGNHAYHSSMLAPLHQAIKKLVSGFQLHAPKIPYVSNVTGTWITDQQATDADYWAQHTWRTVRFSEGLDLLLRTDNRIYLEVGPGQSLGSFVLQHPGGGQVTPKIVLPSLRNRYEGQADEAFFLKTLGKLWLSGAEACTEEG